MYEEAKPFSQPVNEPEKDSKLDTPEKVLIPPKNIKNRSLKGNKNYRKLRKDAKYEHLFNEVVKQLKSEVYNDTNYPIDQYKYDHELVIDVMQLVERIFNEPKLGKIKLKSVCEILKPYFADDVNLIKKFVELNFHKIAKSNFVRRYGIKLFDIVCNFFLGK